jgi:hypothetical protein
MTTIMLRYGRQGMSEHPVVVRGGPVVTADPALGANPQGDVLVEAWIGRWVITYRHSRVRSRKAMKECGDAYRTKAVSSLLLLGRALRINYR